MDNNGKLGMQGELRALISRAANPHSAHTILRIPGMGRLLFTRDPGDAKTFADEVFASRLMADHYDGDGKLINQYDLGSGLVTNLGVLAMSNDFAWSATLNLSTLGTQNFVATGTGATAAAATDFRMQTLASPTTTTAVTGAQSLVAPVTFVGPTSPIFKQITTVNYTSTLAITEWGLHSLATLSASTGTPFTATTVTTWQDTGSAQTASSATVRGLQQTIVLPGTTTVLGLNISNTTHIGTLAASVTPTGWYTQALQAAGATPGATEAFTILPVMWDHKVFSAINVNNGDSIQFTYSLSINSGG
jgi:hypothetical protein